MGYRSDVAIWLNKKAVEKMPQKVASELQELADTHDTLKSGSEIYYLIGVKWYSEFEDVKLIEDFLNSLKEGDEAKYEFLRIGEDDDDTEHHANTECFSMFVNRSINTEFCS